MVERGRPSEIARPIGAFARALYDWMQKKNLNQAAAAKRLGMSVRTLQRWLQEETAPPECVQRWLRNTLEVND